MNKRGGQRERSFVKLCFYSLASTSEHSILPESLGNSLKPPQVRVWPRVSKDAHISKYTPLPTPPRGINIRSHYLPRPLPIVGPRFVGLRGYTCLHWATGLLSQDVSNQYRGGNICPSLGVGQQELAVWGAGHHALLCIEENRSVARMKPREKQKPGTQEGRSPKTPRTPSLAHLS